MATTEERLAALEAKLAQLTATTPTEYYTHQYSGEEIDAAVGRAVTGGALDTSVTNVSNQLGTFVRPNLLDNWYFGRPVNQRGQTEYTGGGYTIDRWRIGTDKNMVLSISDDKLSIVTDTVDSYFNFEQVLEAKVFRVGATYTLSVLVDNYRNINQLYLSEGKSNFIFTDNLVTMTFTVNSLISSNPNIGIQFKTNTTTSLFAAKLELGPTQTLAHREGDKWILNEVPDYGEQLRRCQRYAIDLAASEDRKYGIVGVGVAVSQNEVQFMVPLPTTMRARPVAKFSGTWKFVHGTDTNYGLPVTTINVDRLSTNTVVLNTFTNENLITGDTYMLWRSDNSNNSNNSLFLSSDL